ncbi:MAG: CAP domain-containing protein [Pseudomonadota bacterium]
MRILITLLAAIALAGCNVSGGAIPIAGTVAASQQPAVQAPTRVSVSRSVGIGTAGSLISAERARVGISAPLIQHPALQAAAQVHADDIARRGGLSHTGSDGSQVWDRVSRAGYVHCFVAENIARGQPDVPSVIRAWIGSPGHYRNMVNPAAVHFGFARSSDVWVLVLARPC